MAFSAFATGTAQEQAPRRKSKIALILLLPGILYLALFFLVPLVSLVLTSFQQPIPNGDIGEYQTAFRWENYTDAIGLYGEHILRSFFYAILATIFALLFSYPLAYFIGVKARRWPLLQNLMLVLVIAPFFISFLLRTLAWQTILSSNGIVYSFFAKTHLINLLQAGPYPLVAGNQLLESDIVYVRDLIHGTLDDDQLRKLAAIAHFACRSPDLAARCLTELGKRGTIEDSAVLSYLAAQGLKR